MTAFLFWSSLLFIAAVYFGYPACLIILHKLAPRAVAKGTFLSWPLVTVVIAARNEEDTIAQRLQDLTDQDYPPEKLEIIVVSDGSSDHTADIALSFVERAANVGCAVRLVSLASSGGKAQALNAGVAVSTGDILVFTDARQTFATDAIRQLVMNFLDPAVGGVSGELVLVDPDGKGIITEMGIYWKYEKFIRRMESATGSVMGATGAIYAVKRELFPQLPADTILDDVLVPLHVLGHGQRFIYDGGARAFDRVSDDVSQEWKRKVRTLSGNWQLLSLYPNLLNPFRYLNSVRYFWHKVARLLVPWFLILLLVVSCVADGLLYRVAVAGQFAVYGVALIFPFLGPLKSFRILKLCHFFCVLNLAALYGFVVWVSGRCGTVWKK